MPPDFSPIRGAQGLQMSNPSVLGVASLLGSLQVFKEAGMVGRLRARSIELTGRGTAARCRVAVRESAWPWRFSDLRAEPGAFLSAVSKFKFRTF